MNSQRPTFILVSPKNRTAYNFRGDLLRAISASGYDTVVTGPNDEGVERITATGARFHRIPLDKSGLNVGADLRYLTRLWRLFRLERPQVVLGYTVKPVTYGAIAAKLAGVPRIVVMVTGAGYAFTARSAKARLLRALVSALYRIAFACADVVIFQNPDDQREFTERALVRASKTRLVNGSGVNLDQFQPAPYPQRPTFFMLSRILRSKGVEEYLVAARALKAKHPDVRFMLLGAIENQPDSLTQADLAPYLDDGTIEYFGETDDVASYYRECSVYVLPSYREGTPRTVLEAMAMARPIVTTDAPGCRETVIGGRNGFLVPVGDPNALADRLAWFVAHPDHVAVMGRESRVLCSERFDVREVNRVMMEHLRIGGSPTDLPLHDSENRSHAATEGRCA